jgi:hypothetical protein
VTWGENRGANEPPSGENTLWNRNLDNGQCTYLPALAGCGNIEKRKYHEKRKKGYHENLIEYWKDNARRLDNNSMRFRRPRGGWFARDWMRR